MASWWDRQVVPKLIGFACCQPPVMQRRALVVPGALGEVLELGAGGGANLALYDRRLVSHVTGLEPSPEMIALAETRRGSADGDFFELVAGFAEDLPFTTGRFDTVVSTFTLCSVQDQARALREASRVLKPGGRLLFLEHGLAPDAAIVRWQRRLEPIWTRLAGGCHLTRPVADAVEAAGFRLESRDGGYMAKSPKPLGWTEWGVAVPG